MKNRKIGLHTFMAVPAFALYCLFFIYPLTKGIGMSLTNWNGYGQAEFIGLKNFVDFFKDSRAISDIKTTVLFALGSAPLLNIVGLLYALLMNSKFKGKSVARACIYMPAIISPLIMGYIWYLLLQPGRGVIFNLLNQMGHPEWFPNWMSSYTSEIVVLVLVNVWQYAGMTMIIYLAGLQNISQDLYDAAMIDGATGWQSFRFITLPLLVPSIRINVVTNIIGYCATPDTGCISNALAYNVQTDDVGKYVEIQVPSLEYWDMIYIRYNDNTLTDTVEAENSILTNVSTNNNHGGYSGTGFVDSYGKAGDAVTMDFFVPETGDYKLSFVYSAAVDGTPKRELYINAYGYDSISFPATSNWEEWNTSETTVHLRAGIQRMVVYCGNADDGYINFDCVHIFKSA